MNDQTVLPDGMRGPYGLHETYGLEITDSKRRYGSFYLGPAFGSKSFTFATEAFPEACYYSNGQGEVRGHENVCSHFKHPLISGNRLDRHNWTSPGKLTTCPFHSLAFDLRTGECKGLGLAVLPHQVDQTRLHLRNEVLFSINGFVFRLGEDDPFNAEEELSAGFSLVGDLFPGLFSIDGNNERISGSKFVAKSYEQSADVLTNLVNFLDILHVPFIHADSLGRVCSIEGYRARSNEHVIVQWVPLNQSFREDRESLYSIGFWNSLGEGSVLACPETREKVGAVWVTFLNTGLMLEWYPGVIVVSQCIPGWPRRSGHENDWRHSTFVHHFFYEDSASAELIEGHQKLFEVTGDEDEAYCVQTAATIFREIARGKGGECFGFACARFEDFTTLFYRKAIRLLYG